MFVIVSLNSNILVSRISITYISLLLNILYAKTPPVQNRTGGEIIYKHFEMQQYICSALCGILKVIQRITEGVTEHPGLPGLPVQA